MKNIFNFKSQKGFTLIELMVVIGIIGVLATIVTAFLNGARESGRMAANIQFEANILHGIGDQLIGEWKFDTNGGATTPDTSGYNNTGTLYNAGGGTPIWDATAGYNGKGAYLFNGNNSIATRLKNINTNNITITAWIKPTQTSTGLQGIIVARSGDMSGFVTHGNNDVGASWHGDYGPPTNLYLKLNQWNFIAMSVSQTKIILYVNGISRNYTGNYTPANFDDPNNLLYFGRDKSQPGWPMYLDNIRIYTAPITTAQIQQLYAEGLQTHQDLALTK